MAVASGVSAPPHLPIEVITDANVTLPRYLGAIDANVSEPANWTLPKILLEPGPIVSGAFLYIRNVSEFTLTLLAAEDDAIDGEPYILVQPGYTATLVSGPANSGTWKVLGNAAFMSGAGNKFDGYWQALTKGYQDGFDNEPGLSLDICVDAWIKIDTSVFPIRVITQAGNGKQILQQRNIDIANDAEYIQIDENTLVARIIAFQEDPFLGNVYKTLKIQDDQSILVAADDAGWPYPATPETVAPSRSEDYTYPVIYKKRDTSEVPLPVQELDAGSGYYTDYSRPTELFRYILDYWLHRTVMINPGYNNDFIGYYECLKLAEQYLTTGKTYTSNVVKFRQTKNSSGMTDVFTDAFAFATPGATVTIAGAANTWAGINGTYLNGAGIHAPSPVSNPSSAHVDAGVGGTFPFRFYLRYDSTAAAAYSGNAGYPHYADGVATSLHFGAGPVTVSVTHKIEDTMTYPAFYAAVWAFFHDAFKVNLHQYLYAWTASKAPFLPNDWSDVQTLLSTNHAVKASCIARISYFQPQLFYKNALFTTPAYAPTRSSGSRYSWQFNDPYGLFPEPGNKFDFDVDASNYLVGMRNLYYTLAGTPTLAVHSLIGLLGYPNIDGNYNGGAYFIGTTGPYDPTNPSSGNPDPAVWTPLVSAFATSEAQGKNGFYFGWINPALTGGKRVGYIFCNDTIKTDPYQFLLDVRFLDSAASPSPRFGLEVWARVLSEVMLYLQSEGPLDSLIVDDRTGTGGTGSMPFVLGSLFGGRRHARDGFYKTWSDNGNRPPATMQSLGYSDYNNIEALYAQSLAYVYADETEARYGANSVFKNGKVINLHSAIAASGNDIQPTVCFLGQNNDKVLGNGVTAKIIGDIDGRSKGARAVGPNDSLPTPIYSSRLKRANGTAASIFPGFQTDECYGNILAVYNGRPASIQDAANAVDAAPSLAGGAGGNPLPCDYESTVYVDFGYMTPHPDPPLPGWTKGSPAGQPDPNDNTTWRDRWLEQAILEAIA